MSNIELVCKFLGISKKTWYNWINEERLVTEFIKKYISKEEIEEFIESRSINKYEEIEILENLSDEVLHKFFFQYYTNRPINTIFSSYLFPEFEKYIEAIIEEMKRDHPKNVKWQMKAKYKTKYYFFKFVIDLDENNSTLNISRAEAVNIISTLDELEFFMILTKYRSYLYNPVFNQHLQEN